MDLLNLSHRDEGGRSHRRSRRRSGALFLAALVATGVVSACLWQVAQERSAERFPHSLHVIEEGLDCTDCHLGATDDVRAGMPVAAVCALCHDDLDADREPARRASRLFDASGYLVRRQEPRLSDEVIFAHSAHADLSCADCHGDVAGAGWSASDQRLSMRDCQDCHVRSDAPADCATCHQLQRTDRAPADHDVAWQRNHGQLCRGDPQLIESRCDLCHDEEGCWTCHQLEAPRDHGQYWRVSGHGMAVGLDRQRCATCHQTDFCDRCHQSTPPRSHRAGFAAPRQQHCVTCHFPPQSSGCTTCHPLLTGHATASPLPADHRVAMNCRQCHGAGAPLPHPDKGDVCTLCHR